MSEKETVVAVLPKPTYSEEMELAMEVTSFGMKVESIVVETDEQYAEACEYGRMLKQKIAEVTEFFAPMKKAAHEAHKNICNSEKQMLDPLKNAEKVLKASIGEYVLSKESERKAREEEARKIAQMEAERKLALAVLEEMSGNAEEAQAAMLDAEAAESAARAVEIDGNMPSVKGVTARTDYEIVSLDDSKVPVTVNGVVVRPVDSTALLRLIRESKGKIEIEGVTFKEVAKMTIRR